MFNASFNLWPHFTNLNIISDLAYFLLYNFVDVLICFLNWSILATSILSTFSGKFETFDSFMLCNDLTNYSCISSSELNIWFLRLKGFTYPSFSLSLSSDLLLSSSDLLIICIFVSDLLDSCYSFLFEELDPLKFIDFESYILLLFGILSKLV